MPISILDELRLHEWLSSIKEPTDEMVRAKEIIERLLLDMIFSIKTSRFD